MGRCSWICNYISAKGTRFVIDKNIGDLLCVTRKPRKHLKMNKRKNQARSYKNQATNC